MTVQYHGHVLSDAALDQLFNDARSYNGWLDKPVSDEQIHAIWDLMKMAPTSANCSPARFVFVRTPEGKQRLAPALSKGNLDKTMSAPVTVIAVLLHSMVMWLAQKRMISAKCRWCVCTSSMTLASMIRG